jgi:hypothetical protein
MSARAFAVLLAALICALAVAAARVRLMRRRGLSTCSLSVGIAGSMVVLAAAGCGVVGPSASPSRSRPTAAGPLASTERCRALAADGECGLRKKIRVDGQDVVLTDFRRGEESSGVVGVPALSDAVLAKLAERYELEACGYECGLFLGDFGIGDFTADTYPDLAVTFAAFHPEESDDRLGAGIVVVSGGRDGLRTDAVALLEAGQPPLGEALDVYETTVGVAVGDADADGADDLAFAVLQPDRAYVRAIVVYGSSEGLGAERDAETWHRDVSGVAGSNQPAEAGATVAFGDFDGDSYSDLVIGYPYDDTYAGRVSILYGTGDGLTAARSQEWSKGSPGMPGEGEPGLGEVLAVGDFNGDDRDDLATTGTVARESVLVLYGGSDGLTSQGSQLLTPESGGLPTGRPDEERALSIGWFGGSDHLDLAVVNLVTHERGMLLGSADGLMPE